jgi:uncharacterized protein YjbK
MPAHQEIELKWALTPDAHVALGARLRGAFGEPRVVAQDNRFYDTADRRLRAAACNLRLRCENGRWLVTCKRRLAPVDHGLHQHDEWEDWLPADVSDPLAAALAMPLPDAVRAALAGQRPQALGGFTNDRLIWLADGEEICLDRTDFRQRVDYELEVETPDATASARRWQERLDAWRIPREPQERSKFARFCELHPEARRATTAS